jgi:integrase
MRITVEMFDYLQYVGNGWRVHYRDVPPDWPTKAITRHTGVYGRKDDERVRAKAREIALKKMIPQIKAEIALAEGRRAQADPAKLGADILAAPGVRRPLHLAALPQLHDSLQWPVHDIIKAEYARQDARDEQIRLLRTEILSLLGNDPEGLIRHRDRIVELLTSAAPSDEPCTIKIVIDAWKADRENEASKPAIRNKESKLRALFRFLELRTDGEPDPRFAGRTPDLALVTGADLQRYKEHLLTRGNNVARDHLIDLKPMFGVALDNKKIPSDPSASIKVSAKRDGAKRPPYRDDQAALIIRAARQSTLPIVRWGVELGWSSGVITEEFADAKVSAIAIRDGVPSIEISPEHRVGGEDLKTPFRKRLLPLHGAFADGLLAYADEIRKTDCQDAPLFPSVKADRDGLRRHAASVEIIKLIRSVGIRNEVDEAGKTTVKWDFYCFRKRVTSQLENLPVEIRPSPDRRRYMMGHGAKDVHERVYLDHPLPELQLITNALPDPAGQKAREAQPPVRAVARPQSAPEPRTVAAIAAGEPAP